MLESFRDSRGPGALGPAGFIIGLIIIIALLVLFIYVSQYIYKDAVKRNLNGELWLIIIFILPVISWVIYFLVRNTKLTTASTTPKAMK